MEGLMHGLEWVDEWMHGIDGCMDGWNAWIYGLICMDMDVWMECLDRHAWITIR